MGGFNIQANTHYYPVHSALSVWLSHPENLEDSLEQNTRLGREVMLMAHDYLHSWAYRAILRLAPFLAANATVTPENVVAQAFVVVLTEAVAVTGTDYWYLSVRDVGERLGLPIDVGPGTVHYRERYLKEYRKGNASLQVQRPGFFADVARLYCEGVFAGYDERDLLANRKLADWLIRELLIAPRQREVARLWLSCMGGFEIKACELQAPFKALFDQHRDLVDSIGDLLWRKVKEDVGLFYPPEDCVEQWRFVDVANVDFRFVNVNRLDAGIRRWPGGSRGLESWHYYVDQTIAGYKAPRSSAARARIAKEVCRIKAEIDSGGLDGLIGSLSAVQGSDLAPLEMLFVN
jgi:hypothetical protein